MSFVRKKVSRGRSAYYLVENRREGPKARQKVLAYLGPCETRIFIGTCETVEHAVAYWQAMADWWKGTADKFEAYAAKAQSRNNCYSRNCLRDAQRYRARAERIERRIAILSSLKRC